MLVITETQAQKLELLDEWRRLLIVKEKAIKERCDMGWQYGIALGNDKHAKVWQKAHDRIYEIKQALLGTRFV